MKHKKSKTKAIECQSCIHLKRKQVYGVLVIALFIVVILTVAAANPTFSTFSRKKERERRSFAVSAMGLSDDKGNTIDIHGAGSVGMSGWLISIGICPFCGVIDISGGSGFNLTLWAKGGGSITFTIDGKKYVTQWKAVEKGDYGYTDSWILTKIRLTEPISGLPEELNVELIEGTEPTSGNIILSTGPITYKGLELTHTGVIYSGTGVVVVN